MPSTPLTTLFKARIFDGELSADAAQEGALIVLERLLETLEAYKPRRPNLFTRLTGGKASAAPPGLYIYGDVGRGKSMLMDMFFELAKVKEKRRVHFHQFMLEVHERFHAQQSAGVEDILPVVAKDIATEAWLLCFDEFHVNNIADAMILGRLFTYLFDAGVVVVLTSNVAPSDLYKNGLQRDRFLPFIEIIRSHMKIYNLDGTVDHRFEQTRDLATYFSPLGQDATRKLQGIFYQLTGDAEPEAIILPVQGRRLSISHAAKGVGFFNFDELCGRPFGAADFLAIAQCLHTVILDGVPKLRSEQRDEAVRFTTLIDTLYESHVKLYIAAAVLPKDLAPSGEQAFAFQRTISRLMEMQSIEYRQKAHLHVSDNT